MKNIVKVPGPIQTKRKSRLLGDAQNATSIYILREKDMLKFVMVQVPVLIKEKKDVEKIGHQVKKCLKFKKIKYLNL